MRIVCVSDTHTYGPLIQVPDGDVLVHAGDLTFRGTLDEVHGELAWLASLPHKHKLFIAGNHDFYFDERFQDGHVFRNWVIERPTPIPALLAEYPELTYLQDSSVTLDGVKFYGSPWQPWYYDWAFQFKNGDRNEAARKWGEIPLDTDVLITHGPALGILDKAYDRDKLGDEYLRDALNDLTNLKLHVCGHIHESYGIKRLNRGDGTMVPFVNAAINNIDYRPINAPIVVDL
jgi:calcineurin-like phosphoesterase family protein